MRSRVLMTGLFFVGFSLLWIPTANAYIDPGTGSFIFQAAIGVLLAAGVAIKVLWKRLTRLVTRKDRTTSDV
jgi:hypothetical protein